MWRLVAIMLLAGLSVSRGAVAAEASVDASASLIVPVAVSGLDDLNFGTVSIPETGTCDYSMDFSASVTPTGSGGCAALGGALNGTFDVTCQPNEAVLWTLGFTVTAVTGVVASFPTGSVLRNGIVRSVNTPAAGTCDADGTDNYVVKGDLAVDTSAGNTTVVPGVLSLLVSYF